MFSIFSKNGNQSGSDVVCDTGCFGKLPSQADFARYNSGQREVMALDQWLSQSVGMFSRRLADKNENPLLRLPLINFMASGGESDRSVFGTIAPSKDKSGRSYPFVAFGLSSEPIFDEIKSSAPVILEMFYRSSTTTCESSTIAHSLSELKPLVDNMRGQERVATRGSVLNRIIEKLYVNDLEGFWNSLFKGVSSVDREAFLVNLVSALKEVRRKQPARTSWGIKLPLGTSSQKIAALTFWLRLVEVVLGTVRWRAHYYWYKSKAGDYEAVLFFRQPPESALLTLVDKRGSDGVILDLMSRQNIENANDSEVLKRASTLLDTINRIAATA